MTKISRKIGIVRLSEKEQIVAKICCEQMLKSITKKEKESSLEEIEVTAKSHIESIIKKLK